MKESWEDLPLGTREKEGLVESSRLRSAYSWRPGSSQGKGPNGPIEVNVAHSAREFLNPAQLLEQNRNTLGCGAQAGGGVMTSAGV